jgi:hypothetical protein
MNITILVVMGITIGTAANAGSLTVRSTTGANLVEVVRSPSEKAKSFLKEVASELRLQQSDLSDLEIESVTQSPVGYHIRFAQMKGGLPVHGAGVIVTLSPNNQILSYQSTYQATDTAKQAPEFSISEETAIALAYEKLALTASPTSQTVDKKVMVIDGESRPVYQITLKAPVDQKRAWRIVVDAGSGAIRESRSLLVDAHAPTPPGHRPPPVPHHFAVPAPTPRPTPRPPRPTPTPAPTPMAPYVAPGTSASIATGVFDPNPTIKSNSLYGSSPGFTDANNADSPFFDSMMKATTIQGSLVNGKYVLTGKYVTITDQELPKNPDCSSASPTMKFKRSDACFDDVNAFYHITNSLAYLNETLGIKAGPMLYSGPFHVDPHGEWDPSSGTSADNSHYDPTTDEIAFGEGGIDDAQDHDVLIHELGHAIHNWLTHGHLSQIEGLSEGQADYWASSYSRSQMDPSNVAWNWTFSFDGHNEFWDGRVVNVTDTYPTGVQGAHAADIHDQGQLWASTCMDIWVVLGKEKTDKMIWSGMAMLTDTSSQLDAAKAVYAAALQIYPADAPTVKAKFNARGYTVQ